MLEVVVMDGGGWRWIAVAVVVNGRGATRSAEGGPMHLPSHTGGEENSPQYLNGVAAID